MDFVEYVIAIRSAINARYGCTSYHLSTHRVELNRAEAVWSGDVERLSMQGCTVAEECFAWGEKQRDGSLYFVTVLRLGPVTTPEKAVVSYLLKAGQTYGPKVDPKK